MLAVLAAERMTAVPDALSWPGVLIFAIVGAYGVNQTLIDVWIMLGFGAVGLLMRRFGFSPAPLVMGPVLGKMVEETMKQSMSIFDHDVLCFFQRPIVDVLFAVTLLSIFAPAILRAVRRLFGRTRKVKPVEE